MSANEMEEIAKAAFYITDVARGCTGKFLIEEKGWGEGDEPRALQEVSDCLNFLVQDGWTSNQEMQREAPYTHNIQCAVYVKRFPKIGKRWAVFALATRFGVHCEVTAYDEKPWG